LNSNFQSLRFSEQAALIDAHQLIKLLLSISVEFVFSVSLKQIAQSRLLLI
jgi:hypothetical protein